MEEAIEFTVYPIWERQPEESVENHEKFYKYYLDSPRGSVNKAYDQIFD